MSFAKEKREIVKELGKSVRKDEQLAFLMSARLDRSEEKSQYLNDIMKMLDSKNAEIRKEAIKTLHYLLPNDEEKKIFFRHLENEGSAEVINAVYFYVGRPN